MTTTLAAREARNRLRDACDHAYNTANDTNNLGGYIARLEGILTEAVPPEAVDAVAAYLTTASNGHHEFTVATTAIRTQREATP